MGRIRKGYEARFRALLQHAHARRMEQGLECLLGKAEALSAREGVSENDALRLVYERLAGQPAYRKPSPGRGHRLFLCDAGLGGLARWLRAAGHEAIWQPHIEDDELVRKAREIAATVLTTDSMLMERRVVRDGIIPALWLPPTLGIPEQLRQVFREFGLKAGEPRCMACGGELRRTDKETLRDRIPPRTYRWLDEYFVCSQCNKLFWHGTHWAKIGSQLKTVSQCIPREGLPPS